MEKIEEKPQEASFEDENSQIQKEKKHKSKKKKKLKDKKKNKRKNSDSDSSNKSKEQNQKEKHEQKIKQDFICENFVLLTEIGKGAFGQIFLTYSTRDNEEVAVKKEQKKSKVTAPQLKMEFIVLKTLLHIQQNSTLPNTPATQTQEFIVEYTGTQRIPQEAVTGVPKFYGYGENADYYYIIMQLLGPNLIELFNYCNAKKFTVGTVCMLAIQMINRIEYIHKHHYLHRDIKPENFLIGCGDKSNVIYLIDYGLSKKYKDSKTHQHIPYRENRCLTGTARYVSINTHLGIEQSRRDDLESIGYVLVYFLKGNLPWQGLKNNQDKYAKITEKKLQIPTEILCFGLPDEVTFYLNYCKSLRFEDRPDYDYLRGLFVKLIYSCISQYVLTKEQLKFDWCFDDLTSLWNVYNKNKPKQKKEDETTNSNLIPLESGIEPVLDTPGPPGDIINLAPVINKNKNLKGSVISNSAKNNKYLEEIKELSPRINEDYNETQMMCTNRDLEDDKKNEKILEKCEKNLNEDFTSEGTLKIEAEFVDDIQYNQTLGNEVMEIIENNQKEDIDNYIDKIKNRFSKSKMMRLNTEKKIERNNSENTIENSKNLPNNPNHIILEDILDQESSENSITNFINDTKKLQKQFTTKTSKKPLIEKPFNDPKTNFTRMQSEYQDTRNDPNYPKNTKINKISLKKTYTLDNIDFHKSSGKKTNNFKKDLENQIKDYHNIEHVKSIVRKDTSSYYPIENKTSNSNITNKLVFNTITDPSASRYSKQNSNITNDSINIANNINYKSQPNDNNHKNIQDYKEKNSNSQNIPKISNSNESPLTVFNSTNDQTKLNTGNYENKIIQRINSSEMKEKRKTKILELNNINNNNSNNIVPVKNMKLSKDNIIKISSEPLQKYYMILSDLGHGSYGMVKKVKHKHIGEERAMKIVRKKLDSQNEIEILRKISHPNIISIYEIFEDTKNYYIMSELLEGGELFEEITRNGSFSEYEAANIMKQIFNAVNYMHNKQIVHRDLKPENIMLINKSNSKFEIKIIDFGTAKIFEKGIKLTKFIGTSYYIAPEILTESYDEKCDIWSCGIILYILICGYPPFNGASNLDIYHAIKYAPPSFSGEEWKDVSRDAIELIKIMLNKFPQKRFNAEQCLQHKWFNILDINDDSGVKPKFNQLKVINKMSNFVKENRLKQSVLQFISMQFNMKEEEKSLRQLFQQFDTEKKGYITQVSFYNILNKYFGENESKLIADKMFENMDLDGSGEISYNEFITAIIDNKSMVTNERLEKTFKMFDKDKSGKISLDEIKNVFGGDKEKWRKIIRDIDLDGDGEIDMKEFKLMMVSIDENELK